MTKKTTISEAELQAEFARIDMLRQHGRFEKMTEEQYLLIRHGRSGQQKASYSSLVKYWHERGWGNIQGDSLRALYHREAQKRGDDVD